MSIPVAQLGWMAGVIDLKGRVVTKKNKTRSTPQVVMYVETKESDIIKELARMTGLNPEMKRVPETATFYRRPCNAHCPDAHSCVDESTYSFPQVARWTITGAVIAVVLSNLRPFLRTNRGYDELLLQIMGQASFSGRGMGATVKAIRRMEALGWDIPEEIAAEIAEPPKQLALEAGPA